MSEKLEPCAVTQADQENARAALVAELRKIGFDTHADNVAAGHGVLIPSYVTLDLIAAARTSAAVVGEAEQACRYLGKHNSGGEQSDYNDGFLAACDILGTGTTIRDHVERHKDRILATLPTQDARERVKVLEEALDRAEHKLGHVTVDGMNGDNLAVTLCSHFDDGEGDEDEHGWTEAATAGCDATLKAIHAMYADVLRTAVGNQETDRHG